MSTYPFGNLYPLGKLLNQILRNITVVSAWTIAAHRVFYTGSKVFLQICVYIHVSRYYCHPLYTCSLEESLCSRLPVSRESLHFGLPYKHPVTLPYMIHVVQVLQFMIFKYRMAIQSYFVWCVSIFNNHACIGPKIDTWICSVTSVNVVVNTAVSILDKVELTCMCIYTIILVNYTIQVFHHNSSRIS